MVVTKASLEGEQSASDEQPTFNSNAGHPDEVVQPVREVPSRLVAEAKLRHELAETDLATPQERKQAAVERAHALSTRPDGSYAQLHETDRPSLAVADDQVVTELRQSSDEARESLAGSEPVNSPAGVAREEASARARADASSGQSDKGSAEQPAKGSGSK